MKSLKKRLALLALSITALTTGNNFCAARVNQEQQKQLCNNTSQIFTILATAKDEKLSKYSSEARTIKDSVKDWEGAKLVSGKTSHIVTETGKIVISNGLADVLLANSDFLCSAEDIAFKTIESAATNPKTVKNVAELYKKQKADPYSVVGGLATLVKNDKEAYIKFYPVETPKYPIIKELLEHKGEWRGTLNILKTKFELVEELDYHDTGRVKYFISFFESDASEKRKNLSSTLLIEGYEKKVHRLYMSDAEAMIKLTFEQKIEGQYIGLFHTHLDGQPPTQTDKEIGENEILIAFKKNGFNIYTLPNVKKFSHRSQTWNK